MSLRLLAALAVLFANTRLCAQDLTHEYRPEIIVTLPVPLGVSLSILDAQHLATKGLGPTERQQGVMLTAPITQGATASIELRQVVPASGIVERRWIPSVTIARQFATGVSLRDRVRVEFRDIERHWSRRWQNRLTLGRSLDWSDRHVMPFAYFDMSYDDRFSALNRHEEGVGIRIPAGLGASVEPFVMRQSDTRRAVRTIVASGLILRVVI